MTDLSIVVVNYNRQHMLADCLNSISSIGIPNQVFVVDNGSTDGSADYVAQNFPEVVLIRNEINVGFAKANNQVLRDCQSRYALLLNNDTIVLPGTIETMVKVMDAYPAVGLAGCRLLNPDGSLQPSTYGTLSFFKIFLRLTGLRKLLPKNAFWRQAISWLPQRIQAFFPGYWNHETMREVGTVMGAFFLMRMAAVREVSLLDETTFMYTEEGEWAYRAGKHGWKVYFVPVTGVIHFGGPNATTASFDDRLFVEKHKGLLNIFRKHHSQTEFWLVKQLVIFVSLLKLIYWSTARLFARQIAEPHIAAHSQIIDIAIRF